MGQDRCRKWLLDIPKKVQASGGSTIADRKWTIDDADPHFFSNAASMSFCVMRALGSPG